MKNKLIKDIDEETWREFVAYCKLKNSKADDELNKILENHIQKNFKKLFEHET